LAGVEKHFVGKTPDTLPDWWHESSKQLIAAVDTNKNGDLTLEETKVHLNRVDPALSDDEIEKAFAWIQKLSPAGKFDAVAAANLFFLWATSSEDPPELRTFMASALNVASN